MNANIYIKLISTEGKENKILISAHKSKKNTNSLALVINKKLQYLCLQKAVGFDRTRYIKLIWYEKMSVCVCVFI